MEPLPVPLGEVSAGLRTRQAVRTRGTLDLLEVGDPGYFVLRDGAARVVAIPMPELGYALRRLLGRRVEVSGYVRQLELDQGVCRFRGRQGVPQSLCDDPELPAKPNLDRAGRSSWPTISITAWSGSDITPFDKPKVPDRLGDILDSAGKETITAVGRFCGAGLCGGLNEPAPSPGAWVLADGSSAIWVVGRQPKGNGFSLDPTDKGDTRHWLEVNGRVRQCGAVRCLRAKGVALVASREEDKPDPAPKEHGDDRNRNYVKPLETKPSSLPASRAVVPVKRAPMRCTPGETSLCQRTSAPRATYVDAS